MIKVDLDHNQEVRQQFEAEYLSLKTRIATLRGRNSQLSLKLQLLIEQQRQIQRKCQAALYK